jgi:hypothetical protein
MAFDSVVHSVIRFCFLFFIFINLKNLTILTADETS